MPFLRSLSTTLEMIKWEHSVFALPFALDGSGAGGERLATCHAARLDHRLHGDGALGRDGL